MSAPGIGGLDLGPIVALYRPELAPGLAKYANATDVWLRIVHGIDRPKSGTMRRGLEAEPRLRRAYVDAYGGTMELNDRPWIVRHARCPWTCVSPDDVVAGSRVYVEYKSTSVFARHKWGPEETDAVPDLYQLQVQHGLELLDLPVGHLFVGFGRDWTDEHGEPQFLYEETRRYVIHRDRELAALALAYAERFQREHLETRKPPGLAPVHNRRAFARLMKERPWERLEATAGAA